MLTVLLNFFLSPAVPLPVTPVSATANISPQATRHDTTHGGYALPVTPVCHSKHLPTGQATRHDTAHDGYALPVSDTGNIYPQAT